MTISFSPRDNGACPMCRRAAACQVREALAGSVRDLPARAGQIELVVYSCPQFVEKA